VYICSFDNSLRNERTSLCIPGYFYLGPTRSGGQPISTRLGVNRNVLQFYFVTYAFYASGLHKHHLFRRKVNTGQRFLAYLSNHCKSHREDSLNAIAAMAAGHGLPMPSCGAHCCGQHRDDPKFVNDKSWIENGSRWTNNHNNFGSFKFVLCMENSRKVGDISLRRSCMPL
jgi:hypothetical protein